jgi:predicted nucleic acid-binding protein
MSCSPRRIIRLVETDPADDEVLACALAARAKFIISGDSDLLQLRVYKRMPILSPAAFVRRVLSRL